MKQHLWKDKGLCLGLDTNLFFDTYEEQVESREFVDTLASAAVAVGIAALFTEVHQDPDNAPSDGPCMLRLDSLEKTLVKLKKLDQIAKSHNSSVSAIALAWLRANPNVSTPIASARTVEQLNEIIEVVDLSDYEVENLSKIS